MPTPTKGHLALAAWRAGITEPIVGRSIESAPDELGRYQYVDYWHDPTPVYCNVCGAVPGTCEHGHTPSYGQRAQVFFGPLPADNTPIISNPVPGEEE